MKETWRRGKYPARWLDPGKRAPAGALLPAGDPVQAKNPNLADDPKLELLGMEKMLYQPRETTAKD